MPTPNSPETPSSTPTSAVQKAPETAEKVLPPDVPLDAYAIEVQKNPGKIREYLAKIPPVDYTKEDIGAQKNPIALVQAQLLSLITVLTRDMSDAEFQRLDMTSIGRLITEKRATLVDAKEVLAGYDTLIQNSTTKIGQHIMTSYPQIRTHIESARRLSTSLQTTVPQQPGVAPVSTLPTGTVSSPASSGGGSLWDKTKDLVSENKGAIGLGLFGAATAYVAYRMFGGEGSKDESKWFSGITDWKIMTPLLLGIGVLAYKFAPDMIQKMVDGGFDKFRAFLTNEKTSTIDATGIGSISRSVVEYNNAKKGNDRRSTFPDKLIKSKGGMKVKEFTDENGLMSNLMYMINGGASWLTGTSGALPSGMKQDWEDYQLLLEYTKAMVKKHKIEYTEDAKMDDIWKQILAKEGSAK